MRVNKLDVAYKEDIIKIVAERLNVSEEKVKDIAEFSFKYLKVLMDQEDTATIELPQLGRLHLQFREFYQTYSRQVAAKNNFPHKKFPNLVKAKRKVDTLNEAGIMKKRYHKSKPRFKNTRLTMKMSVEELEIKQNSNGD